MTHLENLTASDQRRVNEKLTEIQDKTGKSWTCEVTKQRQINNQGYILEISVNGQVKRPVTLARDGAADRICQELEQLSKNLV